MPTLKPELKTILDQYGIDPRDKSQIWDCHGTLVLYHKAYEVIAAREKITFDPPTVIEGNSERKTVALLVVGYMGDRAEWSIGEAAPGNCKNAYPYAMAEKRAKDRVIAKLVGLAQYVYSEDEADDFKDAKPAEPERKPEPKRQAAPRQEPRRIDIPVIERDGETQSDWKAWCGLVLAAVDGAASNTEVDQWMTANMVPLDNLKKALPAWEKRLTGQILARRDELANRKAA